MRRGNLTTSVRRNALASLFSALFNKLRHCRIVFDPRTWLAMTCQALSRWCLAKGRVPLDLAETAEFRVQTRLRGHVHAATARCTIGSPPQARLGCPTRRAASAPVIDAVKA